MLYDRLVLDLVRAEEAQRAAERETAHRALVHAQDIVTELLTSLDVEVWNGGAPLAAVYAFLLRELVRANVQQDPEVTRSCRSVVEPLRDAWRQAAVTVSGAGPTPGPLVA
jgi:flagellar protein FliS